MATTPQQPDPDRIPLTRLAARRAPTSPMLARIMAAGADRRRVAVAAFQSSV